MQNEPFISVIVPAYNEERRLSGYLTEIVAFLLAEFPSHEIIVVDDGSTDRTRDIATAILGVEAVVSHKKNQGKGAAIATGMLHAHGRYRLFTDADGSTPISEVKKLLRAVENGAAIAIGSRALEGVGFFNPRENLHAFLSLEKPTVTSQLIANPLRKGAGRVYAFLVRLLLSLPFQDTQCGFKMYSEEAARAVFPQVKHSGYSFDIEALCIARERGFSIAEVPVTWKHIAESKVSLVKDALKMFFDILKIRRLYPPMLKGPFLLPTLQES